VKREAFIHVIQAAAEVAQDELVIVGSQAILGTIASPPVAMVRSAELDLYPKTDPEQGEKIAGAIGEGSPLHETYGYYAHAVGPETVTAPAGWEGRLLRLEVPAIRRRNGPAIGWCLSVPDLMLAKLAAGRTHDLDFVEAALRESIVSAEELERGIDLMPDKVRDDVRSRLDGLAKKVERG